MSISNQKGGATGAGPVPISDEPQQRHGRPANTPTVLASGLYFGWGGDRQRTEWDGGTGLGSV